MPAGSQNLQKPYVTDFEQNGQKQPTAVNGAELVAPNGGAAARGVTVFRLLAAVVESWRLVAFAILLGSALMLAKILPAGRTYTARMTLVTVTSTRTPNFGGALGAGLLNLSAGSGIQATPAFVLRLMRTETVLQEVALSKLPDSGQPLISRVIDQPDRVPAHEYTAHLNRLLRTSVERDAGTILLSVTHRDSSVARLVAARLLESTTRAFARASQAQAAQLRQAQDARLETAARKLRLAEERLVEFLRANRVVPPYSELQIRRQQIEREVDLARTVYSQVVSERESAAAKELEETPALVVLDSIPTVLPRDPRFLAAKLLAAAVASALLAAIFAIMRSLLREEGATGPDVARLQGALRQLPLVRRSVSRR